MSGRLDSILRRADEIAAWLRAERDREGLTADDVFVSPLQELIQRAHARQAVGEGFEPSPQLGIEIPKVADQEGHRLLQVGDARVDVSVHVPISSSGLSDPRRARPVESPETAPGGACDGGGE